MSDPAKTEAFVRLHARYQQRVYSFILTLVPHDADAEDILQETGVVLWKKFDEFRPGSDFVRWANRIAYLEVLKYRRRHAQEKIRFDEELLKEIAAVTADMTDHLQQQQAALNSCLKKLSPQDRDLLERRYRRDATTRSAAEETGRPIGAVYKSLRRIMRNLLACVRREMSLEASR